MKNLRKVIAMLLSLAMVLSFTASAASYSDVVAGTDAAEAVGLLSGLGVIGGYPDGTFGPEKTISRAEYLKILFVLKNGVGSEELYAGSSSKYPDVTSDLWYASYVNWATQLGIVGGYPDGTFKGDNPVTVAEASKMFVVGLGYNAGDFTYPYGFIDRARKSKLYEKLTGLVADNPAPRGVIAQIAYNFLFTDNAPGYGYYNQETRETDYKTPIEQTFKAVKEIGVVVATSTNSPGAASTPITKAGRVAFSIEGKETTYDLAINCDDLVGHQVTIWKQPDDNDELQIVAVVDNTEQSFTQTYATMQVASGDVDQMHKSDIYALLEGLGNVPLFLAKRQADGITELKNGNAVEYYFWPAGTNGIIGTDSTGNPVSNWVINGGAKDPMFKDTILYPWNQSVDPPFPHSTVASFTFMDYEIDSTVDRKVEPWDKIVVNYWRSGEVLSVSDTSITIDKINNGSAIPLEQIKGGDPLANFAVGDYANVSANTAIINGQVKDVYNVQVAKKVTNVNCDGVSNRGVTLGGTAYSLGYFGDSTLGSFAYGQKYDLYLDKMNNIIHSEKSSGEVGKYFLALNVGGTAGSNYGSAVYTVTGLLADGTTKTFNLHSSGTGTTVASVAGVYDKSLGWMSAKANEVYNVNSNDVQIKTAAAVGQVFEYQVNTDGEISSLSVATGVADAGSLYKLDAANKIIYKRSTAAGSSYTIDKTINDNTVIFTFDNKGTPADYTDDTYSATSATKMSDFKDTAFKQYALSSSDTSVASMALVLGAPTSANISNALAMRTYNYEYTMVSDTKMVLSMQMHVNGKTAMYESVPVDVSTQTTVSDMRKAVNGQIFGDNTMDKPKNSQYLYYGYVKFNADGKFEKYYESGNRNVDITGTLSESVTEGKGVSLYRGAVWAIKGSNLVIAQTSGSGVGTIPGTPAQVPVPGGYVTRTPLSYSGKIIVPVASDCMITSISAGPGYVGLNSTKGTLADLKTSSDGSINGTSYVIDFALRHQDNDDDKPLEIYQMIAFAYGTGNYSSENTVMKNDATISRFAERAVYTVGAGTADNPYSTVLPVEIAENYYVDQGRDNDFELWVIEKGIITPTQGDLAKVEVTTTNFELPKKTEAAKLFTFTITAVDGVTKAYYKFYIKEGEVLPTSIYDEKLDKDNTMSIYINPGSDPFNIKPEMTKNKSVQWATGLSLDNAEFLNPKGANSTFTAVNCNTKVYSPEVTIQRYGSAETSFNTGSAPLTYGAVYAFYMDCYESILNNKPTIYGTIVRVVIGTEASDPGDTIEPFDPNKIPKVEGVTVVAGADANGDGAFGDGGTADYTSWVPLTLEIELASAKEGVGIEDLILSNITKGKVRITTPSIKPEWGGKSSTGAPENAGWVNNSPLMYNSTGTVSGTVVQCQRSQGNIQIFNPSALDTIVVGDKFTYKINIYNNLNEQAATVSGAVITIRIVADKV